MCCKRFPSEAEQFPSSSTVQLQAEVLFSLDILFLTLKYIQYLGYNAIRVYDPHIRDAVNSQLCSETPMLRRRLLTVSPPEILNALDSQHGDDEMVPRPPDNISGGTQTPLLDFSFLSGIKRRSCPSYMLHNFTALFLDS